MALPGRRGVRLSVHEVRPHHPAGDCTCPAVTGVSRCVFVLAVPASSPFITSISAPCGVWNPCFNARAGGTSCPVGRKVFGP